MTDFLTFEQIFTSRAAALRFEAILVGTNAPSGMSVLATDCPMVDLHILGSGMSGGHTRVLPRDVAPIRPEEITGQQALFG